MFLYEFRGNWVILEMSPLARLELWQRPFNPWILTRNKIEEDLLILFLARVRSLARPLVQMREIEWRIGRNHACRGWEAMGYWLSLCNRSDSVL